MRGLRGFAAAACVTAAMLALPVAASALTKTVTAGPPKSAMGTAAKVLGVKFLKKYAPEPTQFFLEKTTVNVGDTVSFQINGFHTIDLPGKSGEDLPLIATSGKVNGVKDAAGKLFWFNGHEPSVGLNPALFKPQGPTTYDGTARIDSGLPSGNAPPKPLNVVFTKAGTYRFFCDIHPFMTGEIVVKPTGQSIPSAAQDATALKNQISSALAAIRKASKPKVPKDHVLVGGTTGNGAELLHIFPSSLKVKAGTVVTFSIPRGSREVHTATFGPKKYIFKLSNNLFGPPGPTNEGVYPSSRTMPILLTKTSHGNGFANIGLIDRDPGTPTIPTSGKIKFTTPGVYHFICLIHNNMHGTIIVTK